MLKWQDVPDEVVRLVKASSATYAVMSDVMTSLPDIHAKTWLNPDSGEVFLSTIPNQDETKLAEWMLMLAEIPSVTKVSTAVLSEPPADQPFIRVKSALDNKSVLGPLASLAQLKPNFFNKMF